jgi:hypothetical protein
VRKRRLHKTELCYLYSVSTFRAVKSKCYESQIHKRRRTKHTHRILTTKVTAVAVHEDRRVLHFRVPRSTRALPETCS